MEESDEENTIRGSIGSTADYSLFEESVASAVTVASDERRSTTRLEKVFSPIRHNYSTAGHSPHSGHECDHKVAHTSSASNSWWSTRAKRSFAPPMESTPKAKRIRRQKSRKAKRSDLSLWDKAIAKSPQLAQWIDSFNDDMKKIESSQLSISNGNIDPNTE